MDRYELAKKNGLTRTSVPYHQIPFYRRQTFLVFASLFLMPALTVISLTGSWYVDIDNEAFEVSTTHRLFIAIMGIFIPILIISAIFYIN